MEIARHWRLRDIRLGNPEKWGEIIRQYQRNNPHLTLAMLASDLPDATLDSVHERIKNGLENERKING